MHKIFMFVPGYGQTVSAATFLTTHALQQHLGSKGIGGGISTLSFPDIAELRSMALTIWYDCMKDTKHILFIDNDMGFPPELVTDMIMFDEPLVGTIYPQRKLPLSWAGSGTGETTTERRGNFMIVEGVGMGCTLIRRDCVDIMLQKMPHLVDTRIHLHPAGDTMKQAGTSRLIRAFEKLDIPDRGVVSEDLSFCIRWRECGGKVWAAIGHKIDHVGPFAFSGRYMDTVEQMHAAGAAAPVPGQVVVASTTVSQPAAVHDLLEKTKGWSPPQGMKEYQLPVPGNGKEVVPDNAADKTEPQPSPAGAATPMWAVAPLERPMTGDEELVAMSEMINPPRRKRGRPRKVQQAAE